MAKYLILGAGKQGTALAYYLVKYYKPELIYLVDQKLELAERARWLVEQFVYDHKTKIEPRTFVLGNQGWMGLRAHDFNRCGIDVVISALPHEYNFKATQFAVEIGASYCDFGFDADIIKEQIHAFGQTAINKKISIIPNCGVGPGLVNILALGGARETKCDTVKIYIGGNPQKPNNAWHYKKLFSGLLHEYTGSVTVLEKCELVTKKVPCEPEDIWVDGIGQMEAFFAQTSFGLTADLLKQAGVKNAFEKTIRFPGHYTVVKAFQELGFFSRSPLVVKNLNTGIGTEIVPLDFTSTLINRNLPESDDDFMFLKVVHENEGNKLSDVRMMVFKDKHTAFTAMQQATASVVAIVADMQAKKKLPFGAYLPEQEINYKDILEELWTMGFPISCT